MKIIGIIPARYNSTRFPGKPLVDIQGKSMIQRVYEQAKQVGAFSKIIVATDDNRIYNHVENFGGDVMMTAERHKSGTDRCGEVINTIVEEFDVVINIQGDEPFIQPAQLKTLISAFENSTTQIATFVKKINENADAEDPNIVKVVFSKHHHALYFSRSVIPFNRLVVKGNTLQEYNQRQVHVYYKHIGIYGYRTDILKKIIQLQQSKLEIAESLEQLRWLENNYTIKVIETDIETVGIDTPDDLERTRRFYP